MRSVYVIGDRVNNGLSSYTKPCARAYGLVDNENNNENRTPLSYTIGTVVLFRGRRNKSHNEENAINYVRTHKRRRSGALARRPTRRFDRRRIWNPVDVETVGLILGPAFHTSQGSYTSGTLNVVRQGGIKRKRYPGETKYPESNLFSHRILRGEIEIQERSFFRSSET